MNILFNASGCGLGNNGGSKTIIKSAETLQAMGHGVSIMSQINNYTWHRPKVHIDNQYDFPLYDVIINVSVWDVEITIKNSIENKIWWMRGWEKWVRGEEWLIQQIKKFVSAGGRIIVNATHLKHKLKTIGVESVVVFAGLDLEFWNDNESLNRFGHNLTIGALHHKKHKTKNYETFLELQRIIKEDNEMRGRFAFKTLYDKFNNEQLRKFYNECDIWLSLSSNEGFHQAPAEAALCGNLILYYDVGSGGTQDYCIASTAIPFEDVDHIYGILKDIESYGVGELICDMQIHLRDKIGNRETNMKKFVEVINEG